MKNLYLISQSENGGYDTFDSAVVCAPDEETARNINPSNGEPQDWQDRSYAYAWASAPEKVEVKFLGRAARGIKLGLVCASFNAG